jgi:hypothetical protein
MRNQISEALVLCSAILLSSAVSVSGVSAENLEEVLGNTKKYFDSQNYPKAMSELEWAKKEIEKAHNEKLKSYFPAQIIGLNGGNVEANGALGFSVVERSYNGEGKKVKLSIIGGSGGGQNPLGALGQINQMAAMFGQQAGMDSFRIKGRTATLQDQGGRPEATVTLSSGGILKLEAQQGVKGDELKTALENFDLDGLDNYLGGKQG